MASDVDLVQLYLLQCKKPSKENVAFTTIEMAVISDSWDHKFDLVLLNYLKGFSS